MVGLTHRKLYTASPSHPSFFYLYIHMWTCCFTLGRNIDFSGQTVKITFGKNLPIPLYNGHVDLHLGDWWHRSSQSHWDFLGTASLPAVPGDTHGRQWLWLHLCSPTPGPGQEIYKDLLLDIMPFFTSTPLPFKKKYTFSAVLILPTEGLFSPVTFLPCCQVAKG